MAHLRVPININHMFDVQHRRYVGYQGELVYVTDTEALCIHDGRTPGGQNLLLPVQILKSELQALNVRVTALEGG